MMDILRVQQFDNMAIYRLAIMADISYSNKAEAAKQSFGQPAATDHQLMEAVAAGDESAFEELMSRHSAALINFLYRFIGNREDAIDIAQETFVRIFLAADRYKSSFAFTTYLYRIASNLAISHLRSRKRRFIFNFSDFFGSRESGREHSFEPEDKRKGPDLEFEETTKEALIIRALMSLPEKYRLPIVLRDIQEHSYEQVASILNLGLGTTKSRISRGRQLLRKKLDSLDVRP